MIKKYNRKEAVSYAENWALSSNPKFYHFGGIGGDCTNFISQCLYAGSGVMNYNRNDGWYYISSYKRSPSWTSVEFLERYLTRTGGVGPIAEIAPINTLEIGDLIQLRQNPTHFNHTVIITKIENGEIFVSAHSNDALNKPLKEYFYLELKGLHITGVNV